MLKRKGQSTLEYVLILTAIIAAVIAIAGTVGGRVRESADHVTGEMLDQVERIQFGAAAVAPAP